MYKVKINAAEMQNKYECYRLMEIKLQLPHVYDNWDSLFDWLTDLSWISDSNIFIEIVNIDMSFINDKENKTIFIELLNDTMTYWNNHVNVAPFFKKVMIVY